MTRVKIEISCSAMTGKIYLTKVNVRGNVTEKTDVTKQIINAVMQHMDVTKEEYECAAGDLIFKPKGEIHHEAH